MDKPGRILIVDDHESNLAVLAMGLEAHQYEVIQATSGEDALTLAKRHSLALILLDIKMSGMSGY